MQRLLPNPGPTSVAEQLAELDFVSRAHDDRPYVFVNFALTLDGAATIGGRSGPIGSDTDTELLVGLRLLADAMMIGAGTLRVERYGRLVPDAEERGRRERRGLPADPLAVIVSGRLDLPWDAGIFTSGGGRVLIFTGSDTEPPPTATSLRVERHAGGIDLREALRYLRQERGIRALLCEGGPHLHAGLLEAGLVDEIFISHAPKLAGGEGPGLVAGLPEAERGVELVWLLHEERTGELFARYRRL